MDSAELVLSGLYRGIVTTTDDPAGQLRIKAKVPQVFGDDDSDWALPALQIGLSQIPSVNDRVWVMFEAGDPNYPVYIGSWAESGIPVLVTGDVNDIPLPIPGSDIAPGTITNTQIADFSIAVTKYNDSTHHFNPPVLTSNSPTAGSISWSAFTMVYQGVAYTIAAGNTNQPYAYWVYGGTTLTTSATLPSLTVNDCLILLNKSGVAFNAQLTQAIDGSLLVNGSIGTNQLAANSITATQISAGAINGQTITGAVFNAGTITGNTISGGTISGTTISGTTITGGTIVGSTIETAASGARMIILGSGGITFMEFDSGLAGSSVGYFEGGSVGTGTNAQPILYMNTGSASGVAGATTLYMVGESTSGASSPQFQLTSGTTVSGDYQPSIGGVASSSAGAANLQLSLSQVGLGVLSTITLLATQIQVTTPSFVLNGVPVPSIAAGTYSGTTDGSAFLSFNHGLTWAPTRVFLQSTVPNSGINQGYPVVTTLTSTTVTMRYMATAGATTGLAVAGWWLAIK